MSVLKTQYGSSGQTMTCTLASLASGSSREATSVDNTGDLFLDVLVMLSVKTQSGTISTTDPYVYVYCYGTVDGGTTWPDAVTGTDAAITLQGQLVPVGSIKMASAVTRALEPFNVAEVFGGVVPAKWGIIVQNNCNIALSATEGDHKKLYQGFNAQAV